MIKPNRTRLAALVAAAVATTTMGLLANAGQAFAASPNGQTVTETNTYHGSFYEPQATNPCNDDTMNQGQGPEFTGNLADHVTFFTQSDELWATFTETGNVVGTDDYTGVTYTGKATAWGNFNMNERNQNSEFTLSIHLTGSDGSSITGQETTVFVDDGHGVVTVSFDKMNLTCG